MKLGVWNDSKDLISGDFTESYLLKEANILEAHRFIYLFFDKDTLENHKLGLQNPPGTRIYGKAIQINLSVTKGLNNNYDIPPFLRGSDNSTYMIIGMYVYDTIFDRSILNIQTAEFTLLNSMVSSTTNEYNLRKSMSNGINLYEKDIRDKPDIKDLISAKVYAQAPSIPEPMYYTMTHQELGMDEIYCLTDLETSVVHRGNELIDEFTKVSVMDSSLLDTLEPRLRAKLVEIKSMNMRPAETGVNMYDQTMLSEWLLYQDFESMQSGYTYIYDTNMGFNIMKNNGGFIPFRKFQFEDKMVGDIERTKDTIIQHAKGVEKKFGSVRMIFTPLYYGDKTDVFFKDYNKDNQPTLKENLNIDSGEKIKNEVSTIVQEAKDEYIQYDLDGDIGDYSDGLQNEDL